MDIIINPLLHFELLIYVTLVALMMAMAFTASLPPRRNAYLFLGATVLFASWILTLSVQKITNSLTPVGIQTAIDIVTAVSFYIISRPQTSDKPGEVRTRDWSANVFFVYAAMMIININHMLFSDGFDIFTLRALIYFSIVGIIALGVLRGYSLIASILTVAGFAVTTFIGTIHYNLTMNVLFIAAILIITFHATISVVHNFKGWINAIKKKKEKEQNSRLKRKAILLN